MELGSGFSSCDALNRVSVVWQKKMTFKLFIVFIEFCYFGKIVTRLFNGGKSLPNKWCWDIRYADVTNKARFLTTFKNLQNETHTNMEKLKAYEYYKKIETVWLFNDTKSLNNEGKLDRLTIAMDVEACKLGESTCTHIFIYI